MRERDKGLKGSHHITPEVSHKLEVTLYTTLQCSMESNMITEPLLDHRRPSKGGLRTLPFIIANEAFEKVASYGLLPNMIVYLMQGYGFNLVTGSNLLYLWSAANSLTPLIGALLADSLVGRFWMIGFGSVISLLGTFLLWLTTIIPGARPCGESDAECSPWNIWQITLLVSSFGLMSVGAGGIRSSSMAFGADQLMSKETLESAGLLERFFSWYYISASASVVLALSLVVYIQEHLGWRVGFGVPVMLMFLSTLSFFFASHTYIKLKPTKESSPITFLQVLMASWKKRHLCLSSERTDELYHYRKGGRVAFPTNKLRFLNKACIIGNSAEELAQDGTALNPWRLCTVEQVEELKLLIKVIPIWSTGVMMSVTMSQNAFPRLQVASMDRHVTKNFEIPAGSFGTFMIIFLVSWIALYDRAIIPLATKIMRKPVQLGVRTRIGIGLLLSVVSTLVAAVVESVRRNIAIEEGFAEDSEAIVHMSALWLLPNSFVSGVAEAFVAVGLNEFFYSELPQKMASVATNLFGLSMCVASVMASLIMNSIDHITSQGGKESWVSSNINKAHFDYYYSMLACLCLLNFFFYLYCCKSYDPPPNQGSIWVDEEKNVAPKCQ